MGAVVCCYLEYQFIGVSYLAISSQRGYLLKLLSKPPVMSNELFSNDVWLLAISYLHLMIVFWIAMFLR